jgi:hypothetical protein
MAAEYTFLSSAQETVYKPDHETSLKKFRKMKKFINMWK